LSNHLGGLGRREETGGSTSDFVWQPSQISDGYPATPGGQLSLVSDELPILAHVPGGFGMACSTGHRTGSPAWAGNPGTVWGSPTST